MHVVGGSIQLVQGGATGIGGATLTGNEVKGDVQLFSSVGSQTVTGNRIDGNLQCKENTPAPTGSGNVVGGNKAATRRISAARCDRLTRCVATIARHVGGGFGSRPRTPHHDPLDAASARGDRLGCRHCDQNAAELGPCRSSIASTPPPR
jgi:hypothetical protein